MLRKSRAALGSERVRAALGSDGVRGGQPGRTPPPSGSAACRALPWQLSNSIALVHAHDTHHTVFSHRLLTSAQAERHTWRPRTNPCQPFEFTGSRGFPVNTHSHTRTQGHISSHEETADTPGKAKGRERGRGRGRRQRRRSSDRWQRSLLRLSRSAVCAGCASGEGASVAARGHAAAAASRRAIIARRGGRRGGGG